MRESEEKRETPATSCMQQENIQKLASGVMGWTEYLATWRPTDDAIHFTVRRESKCLFKSWNPYESVADAFEVVEAIRAKGWECDIWDLKTRWRVIFKLPDQFETIYAQRETVPLAICAAALLWMSRQGDTNEGDD